jgi:hypothetical protein
MKVLHLSDPSHGWIDITFGREPNSYTIQALDVPNDCLLDLASATARILRGSPFATAQFSLEPSFATCELHRESESVRVVIRGPDIDSKVFESTFPIGAFAQGLRSELLRIRHRYSADDGWTQPFPCAEVDRLTYENGA